MIKVRVAIKWNTVPFVSHGPPRVMATVCKSFVCEDLGAHMFKEKIVMIHISKILFQS